MMILYIFIFICCLVLIYLMYIKNKQYKEILSGNIHSILTLDNKNRLIFLIPFKSKYCEPHELYEFKQNVLYNDPMTGNYYAPGLVPIICNTEERFEYWKNKLNTCGKVWEWEKEEFEKYKTEIYSYLNDK